MLILSSELASGVNISLTWTGTLRTRYSELSYSDQTAPEIASDQGHYDIARITAPVIRSPVPHQVLDELEKKFHSLIECDIGARVDHEHLYLPKLILLTELGAEAMWFEVKSHLFLNAVGRCRDIAKSEHHCQPQNRVICSG